jgi:hypothetical protein
VSREESLMEHIHSLCLIEEDEAVLQDRRAPDNLTNPSVLEEMLIRIIGRNAAEHALTYVKDGIKTSILYNNP